MSVGENSTWTNDDAGTANVRRSLALPRCCWRSRLPLHRDLHNRLAEVGVLRGRWRGRFLRDPRGRNECVRHNDHKRPGETRNCFHGAESITTIVVAGLAGCLLAVYLGRAGWEVDLRERLIGLRFSSIAGKRPTNTL